MAQNPAAQAGNVRVVRRAAEADIDDAADRMPAAQVARTARPSAMASKLRDRGRWLAAASLVLGCMTPAIPQSLPTPQVLTRPDNDNSPFAASTAYVDKALNRRAPIDPSGNIFGTGLKSTTDGTKSLPVCPFWACFKGQDIIRYANWIDAKTVKDGAYWESPLGIDYHVTTGYKYTFASVSGKAVTTGQNIEAQPSAANEAHVYRVTRAGTLGTSASTWPTLDGTEFTSGTAKLKWINFTNLAVKIGFTNTTYVADEGGATWLNNFNFEMQPLKHQPRFQTNTEFDFKNNSGYDCLLFSGNTCNAINVFMGGGYRSTVALNLSSTNKTTDPYATEWGLWVSGPKMAADAAVELNTNSTVALGIGRHSQILGTSTYSDSVVRDEATSPRSLMLAGTYSQSAIDTQGATIAPQGGFPTTVVMAPGQQVCWAGFNVCWRFDSTTKKMMLRWNGQDLASIDGNGNARYRGTVTGGVVP